MEKNYSLKLEINFESTSAPKTILKALAPDLSEKYSRSKTLLKAGAKKLFILIKASDLTALRASFNSLLKSIIVSNELIESTRG